MVMITPEKLKVGDEIRVIAPSRGLKILSQETIDTSLSRLTELGFKVTFGRNVNNFDEFMSSTISDRVSDLHEAFSDKNVKAILTVIGGFNSNMLIENTEFELNSSSDWSDDLWFLDQENREFIPNEGMYCINEGTAEGSTTGGNISTFSLLSGTQYFPSLDDKIIILEAHGEVKEHHFDRLLQQLIQQDNFSKAKGLVIGMFQKECKINRDKLLKIIKNKRELDNIPVIANANFGHTTPIATLPLGGKIEIISSTTNCKIKIKV